MSYLFFNPPAMTGVCLRDPGCDPSCLCRIRTPKEKEEMGWRKDKLSFLKMRKVNGSRSGVAWKPPRAPQGHRDPADADARCNCGRGRLNTRYNFISVTVPTENTPPPPRTGTPCHRGRGLSGWCPGWHSGMSGRGWHLKKTNSYLLSL